ncbi:hypothetical protein HGP16_25515 [Rhizobium sp. P40RR-XXII]|uniref:hypothetical protein n=1 Tax=Rhizobium sp. P40RR-XXII TaxID=2726739 RepID=UPI00145655A8|nr:hypothetical protein [Rhizobium sp. P40RR-XXII]NLS19901.1 hypothetical protein [Rhizobium sp. P40RR-XXII]
MKTLHPTKMRNAAEYVRTQHHVIVDPDHTIEDVLKPGYWAHHAERIRVYDLIDVIHNDFDLTLRVTGRGIGFVETRVLRAWISDDAEVSPSSSQPAKVEADIPDGYVVDHTPKTGWRARLKDGGAEISRNHKSKSDAIQAAINHAARAQGIAA